MAIYIYCQECRNSCAIDNKICPKCGFIFDRKKKYRMSVTYQGERISKILNNLTIARELEANIKNKMITGYFDLKKDEKALTLDELWEKYLPYARENKKSWRADMSYYKKHVQPCLGAKRLDEISPFELEKLKIAMGKGISSRGKPYSKATIKHQLVIIRRLYNVAAAWGLYAGKNPCLRVRMPRLDNQKDEYLTNDEMARLLDMLDRWPFAAEASLVRFALFTGFRRGEIFKLKWQDCDFEQGNILIRDPKGGKSQSVPVSVEALDALKALRAHLVERNALESEYCFPGKGGGQRKHFKRPWANIKRAAGIREDFSFHGLRHNFASMLISNGVDLYTVKELLTHKDMKTTERYAHLAPGRLRDAALRSGKLLTAARKDKKLIKLRKRNYGL